MAVIKARNLDAWVAATLRTRALTTSVKPDPAVDSVATIREQRDARG